MNTNHPLPLDEFDDWINPDPEEDEEDDDEWEDEEVENRHTDEWKHYVADKRMDAERDDRMIKD